MSVIIKKLKVYLKHIEILDFLYQKYIRFRDNQIWKERKVSFGRAYPEKQFYVLRRYNHTVGLASHIAVFLGMLQDMEKRYPNAVPVVDLTHYRQSIAEKRSKRQDIWEEFFKQPGGMELQDIYISKNVILSNGYRENLFEIPDLTSSFFQDPGERRKWKNLFDRYFVLSDEMKKRVEKEKERIFEGERVLGVLCRGTDYLKLRPKNHFVQPDPEEVIKKTKEMQESRKCKYIFLATEDKEIIKKFEAEFGDSLKMNQQIQVDYKSGWLYETEKNSADDRDWRLQRSKEYLTALYLLSQCDCLIAGKVNGLLPVLLWNICYEEAYFFDLGRY